MQTRVRNIRLGRAVLAPDLLRIERGEAVARLSPKATAVLAVLANNAGRVISREAIFDEVWGSRHRTSEVLTHAIRECRQALASLALDDLQIETVPRVGYRLVVMERSRWRLMGVGLAAATVALLIPLILLWPAGPDESPPSSATMPRQAETSVVARLVNAQPVLEGEGGEELGSVSPDGHWLAYHYLHGGRSEIVISPLNGSSPRTLTDTPDLDERYPVWTPDGERLIYYGLRPNGSCELRWLAINGATHGLISRGCWPADKIDVSPDGERVVFPMRNEDPDTAPNLRNVAIHEIHLDGTGLVRRTYAETPARGDVNPRYSPDGVWITFFRTGQAHDHQLMIQPLNGNPSLARPLRTDSWVRSYDWHPSGRFLALAAHRSILDQAQLLDLQSGLIVEFPLAGIENVTFGPHGDRLYFQRTAADFDIWELSLGDAAVDPQPLIDGEAIDFNGAYSPAADSIVYASTRSGLAELYLRNTLSGEENRLTWRLGGGPHRPVWAPDGGMIVFLLQNERGSFAQRIDLPGGRVSPIEHLAGESVTDLQFSADGSRLYYISERHGSRQLWRSGVHGGPREQLTVDGAVRVQVVPDGRVFYSRPGSLFQLDDSGLHAEVLISGMPGFDPRWWAVVGERVYFVERRDPAGQAADLMSIDLAGGQPLRVAGLGRLFHHLGDLSVRPDGRALVFEMLSAWHSDIHAADFVFQPGAETASDTDPGSKPGP